MAKNVSLIFCRSVMTVKPHSPMIKFRYGSPQKHSEVCPVAGHSSRPAAAPAVSQSKASNKAVSRPTIEDHQLPPRYRRHGLSDAEIDAINSGGAY